MINLADSSGLKMRFDQDTGRRHLSALPEGALCRGRAESKAEGKAEGEIAAKSSFLLSLLVNPLTATLPNKDIATLCGLSVAEVEGIPPQASRIVEIPNEDGSTRPLAISCFEDKLVQLAVSTL